MTRELSRLKLPLLTGNEPLTENGNRLGPSLIDFWRWSISDLVDNTTRGALAEFIVACALGENDTGAPDGFTPGLNVTAC